MFRQHYKTSAMVDKGVQRILHHLSLIAMLLILSTYAYSQDSVKYIPDGTEGEFLEVVENDTVPQRWRDKRWRLFPGRFSTLKLGGGFLYEFAGFKQDDDSKRQADSAGYVVESAFKVRDFRLVASGQFKTKRSLSWKVGLMYDGASDSWLVRETGIMVGVPELWSHFFIGRTKEGFSMNKVMNGYAGWTLERQMAIDVIPILADGVKWLGFLPKQRVWWNLGVFADWLSSGQSFSTYKWQLAARIGWLPIYSKADNTLLHVGMNYRFGEPVSGNIRLRSRPEANPAPYFIDTQTFSSSGSNHFGPEVYFSKGSWMFGSEYYVHQFNSPESSSNVFFGGEVVAMYIITGERRPYSTVSAIYGFVPVARPVFKGGPGAWEVVFRVSHLNLNDGPIQGGNFWRVTPMVNWYLSKDVRLELAYGYGELDRFNIKGTTQFFQARLQLTLL